VAKKKKSKAKQIIRKGKQQVKGIKKLVLGSAKGETPETGRTSDRKLCYACGLKHQARQDENGYDLHPPQSSGVHQEWLRLGPDGVPLNTGYELADKMTEEIEQLAIDRGDSILAARLQVTKREMREEFGNVEPNPLNNATVQIDSGKDFPVSLDPTHGRDFSSVNELFPQSLHNKKQNKYWSTSNPRDYPVYGPYSTEGNSNKYWEGADWMVDKLFYHTLSQTEKLELEALMRDPLGWKFRHAVKKIQDTPKGYLIKETWSAQALKTMAHACLYFGSKKVTPKLDTQVGYIPVIRGMLADADVLEFNDVMRESDIYLWTRETVVLAETMPEPDRLLIDSGLLTTPMMFWVFEEPMLMRDNDDHNRVHENTWMLLVDGGEELVILHDSTLLPNGPKQTRREISDDRENYIQEEKQSPMEIIVSSIPYGTLYEDLDGVVTAGGRKSLNNWAYVVKMLAFLQTKAAHVEERPTERSVRRQLKKEGRPTTRPDINWITLRKVRYKGRSVPMGDGTKKQIRWAGRWWVAGHWTNQPYGPGRSLRRPQWIDTYAKGPEDLPFIKKGYHVTR